MGLTLVLVTVIKLLNGHLQIILLMRRILLYRKVYIHLLSCYHLFIRDSDASIRLILNCTGFLWQWLPEADYMAETPPSASNQNPVAVLPPVLSSEQDMAAALAAAGGGL